MFCKCPGSAAPTGNSFAPLYHLQAFPLLKMWTHLIDGAPFSDTFLPFVCSFCWSTASNEIQSIRKTKVLHCFCLLTGKPFQRKSMAFLQFLEHSGLQCLLPHFQQHRVQGTRSALLSGHLHGLQSLLASACFFGWSDQGVTPAFFKELSQLLSIVELYGMWTGALMVQNTSAHQKASASLAVCLSVSTENSSFTVFYISLVFSTWCSATYCFRLCKMLWRCLFQREFCLKSRRTLQAVQCILLPLVWKLIWILYFSA